MTLWNGPKSGWAGQAFYNPFFGPPLWAASENLVTSSEATLCTWAIPEGANSSSGLANSVLSSSAKKSFIKMGDGPTDHSSQHRHQLFALKIVNEK